MASRRVRFAVCALLTFALAQVQVADALAQQFGKPASQQSGMRQQRPQQNRQGTGQRTNTNQGKQGNQPAGRMASKPQPSAQPKQAAPKSIEKLSPEKRAEFLKLIGANWIWSPAYTKDDVPVGDCYFRKTFQANMAEVAQVHIACDNQYELFVNGRLAGRGNDWRKLDVHDISQFLVRGNNVLAIKATNSDAGAAGLVARVLIKEKGGTFESFSSDGTWRTTVKPQADWMQARVRDNDWLPAKVYGPLGGVLPWGDEIVIADEGSRFVTDPEFVVDRLVTDQQGGSLIAMTFNANGDILASREGAGLLLIRDTNKDGTFETVDNFSTEVKNIQGILSLGNRVYAIGDGPSGGALYQITDADGDGHGEKIVALVKFRGVIGEHGPHKVHIGPDGLLYLLSGNFAQAAAQLSPHSPYSIHYEGEMVLPRYEDPQGHAVGVPAPGGTILRTDINGSFVEMVAGGFRNPYDFSFTSDGEMFTADADMEWDNGAPWYRPTRLIHAPLGGEFGWRSGWAKWPAHYLDSLPATVDTGPGSPTGMAYYNHTAFPPRLQNTLFVADWAQGHINAVKLERNGAS